MTSNQIAYWNLQEAMRANRAREIENNRSNLAKERENYRSNAARERENLRSNLRSEQLQSYSLGETKRSNLARETETRRSNLMAEYENRRAHMANEKINLINATTSRGQYQETRRSNLERERLNRDSLANTIRYNEASVAETIRSNQARELQNRINNETNVRLTERGQNLQLLGNLFATTAKAVTSQSIGKVNPTAKTIKVGGTNNLLGRLFTLNMGGVKQ